MSASTKKIKSFDENLAYKSPNKSLSKKQKKSPPIPCQLWLIKSILGKYILGLIVELKFNAQPGSQILSELFTICYRWLLHAALRYNVYVSYIHISYVYVKVLISKSFSPLIKNKYLVG